MSDLYYRPVFPQSIGDLLLPDGAQAPTIPPDASVGYVPQGQPPVAAGGLSPDEQQFLDQLRQAPPAAVPVAPPALPLRSRIGASIADALGAYAAASGRNPSLRTNFLGQLQAQDERARMANAEAANRAATQGYEAKTRAAEAGLSVSERRQASREAQTAEGNRLKSEQDFRREMQENQQKFQGMVEANSNALKREAEANRNKTDLEIARIREDGKSAEDKTLLRQEKEKADAALLKGKQAVLTVRDMVKSTPMEQWGPNGTPDTPEGIREHFVESMDALGLREGSPQRKELYDYFIAKAEPILQAAQAKADADAKAKEAGTIKFAPGENPLDPLRAVGRAIAGAAGKGSRPPRGPEGRPLGAR